MRTTATVRLAALLLACATLTACGRAATVGERDGTPVAELPPAPLRSEAWKLDRMITCYNDADERAHAAVSGYLAWIASAETGPSGRERHIGGIAELPAQVVDKCSDQMHLAHTEGPAMRELDGAARAYLAALRDLSMQILPLHRYYQGGVYKDDGFARGRALHAGLMESARQFERASETFSTVLDRENERHLLARLAELQDGDVRDAGYYRVALAFDGRRLVRLLESDAFSRDEAKRQIASFERIAGSAGTMKRPDGEPVPELRFVNDRAGAFLRAAKLRAGTARGDDGSRDHLLRAYRDLVEGINTSR
ncbi:MAG TPA: DUF3829 domain-containing protein [Telluria sp.]|nr:DUF3829 domain-containing protein [Telluria sp.]